jgi:methanogenic corrinoid protein MtbC1
MATGVSESRLRTWERRYGIPSPNRSSTGRRLYEEGDLEVIRRMAALVESGISPVEAALAARLEAAIPAEEPAAPERPAVDEILQGALAFDAASVVKAVRLSVESLGWETALGEVIYPGLKKIGVAWSEGVASAAQEHFLSELVRQELSAELARTAQVPASAGLLLMACPEDERHEIGLLGLAVLCRRAGIGVIYLGADVPPNDVVAAAVETEADGICLAAATPAALASMRNVARTLSAARVRGTVFVGGPALKGPEYSVAGTRLPQNLGTARDVILGVLRSRMMTGAG